MATKIHHHIVYILLRSVLSAGSKLPLTTLRRFGRLLAPAAFKLSQRRRRRISQNLEMAMPELDGGQRRRLAKQVAQHFGKNLAEVIWMQRATAGDLTALVEIEGLHHLEKARESGSGAILATAHCGNWEFLGTRLSVAGIPTFYAVRDLYDERVDNIITGLRSKFGTEVIHRGKGTTRKIFGALAHNKVNGLLIDQDIKDLRGTFVPFFGRLAWTPTGAAQLSLKLRAPMVPAFIHRRDDGSHLIEIHPQLEPRDDLDKVDSINDLTARATSAIEEQVRRHPAQWVWMHRRWRTRPEDDHTPI